MHPDAELSKFQDFRVRKKIFIVTTVPETFTSILKGQPRSLSEHYDVELVTSPDDGPRAIDEGVIVHRVPMVRGINVFRDMLSVMKMTILLFKASPRAVHSYTPKAGLVSMLAAWICRVPVRVHTFTGLIFPTQTGFKKTLLIWIDRLICACATRIVPEGEGVKNDLIKHRVTSKAMFVIGHGNVAGVDVSYFDPDLSAVKQAAASLLEQLHIPPDGFVFCFVGRLNKDKGIKELALSFQQLPPTAHLIIVGDNDTSAPVDRHTMTLLESNSRVHRLGFQDDIRPALACADVLVLPSYREGFPNVVLQAGAMKRPALVTDISGCNEIIEPGFNGWLVPPQQHHDLTAVMQQVITIPAQALDQMGSNARQRVVSRFDRKDHLVRMTDFYKELLDV